MSDPAIAVAATVILAGLACFQALLVAGAPLGRYAWGGQHDVLPRTLRIASAVSIAIYVVIALVILARGTVIGHVFGEPVTRIGIWVLTGYFALGAAPQPGLEEQQGADRDDACRPRAHALLPAARPRGRAVDPAQAGPAQENYLRALDCAIECTTANGELADAIQAAEDALAIEPFRETTYQRLMRAHAARGNRAEALRTYQRCRRVLADELGVHPSPATEAVYAEIVRA